MERAGEKIPRLLCGRKKLAFFGNEVLQKMYRKEQCQERKAKRVNCEKLMPIIYVKGSCFETALYDHVLGDKRRGDKGRGMRKGRS